MAEKTGLYINCENCGKQVYKTLSQYKKGIHHFCSTKCQKEYNHKQTHEHRRCEICGKQFEVSKKSKQRFCSTECQNKWQTTRIGSLNPRTNRIRVKCDWCGKDLSIIPANLERFNHHFCGDKCSREWRKNVLAHDKEYKDASRQRAARILKNNPVNLYTKPQIMVNELLTKMNIRYENEYTCKYYSIDNFLQDYNLMIEVMGDFWHSNPIKYSSKKVLRDMQRKSLRKDKAKNTYVHNYYDTQILYLWEHDIYNNIDLCEKLIELYINTDGILENYHSFNYHLENDGLIKLNDKIIYPYFELEDVSNA